MSNRTDEAKLVHFMVHGLGMRVELDGSYWLDGTLMSAESKPDFAQDEAQMGRVFEALDRVTPD
ncbi:MAG: hypothetical protein GY722_04810, partial [bacterium]|nr:hypothetical protein [bacterium]